MRTLRYRFPLISLSCGQIVVESAEIHSNDRKRMRKLLSAYDGIMEIPGVFSIECSALFRPYLKFAGLPVKSIQFLAKSAVCGQKYESAPLYQVNVQFKVNL